MMLCKADALQSGSALAAVVVAKHLLTRGVRPRSGSGKQAQKSRPLPRLLLAARATIGSQHARRRCASHHWHATEHAPSLKHVTPVSMSAGAAAAEAAGLVTRLFALRQPLLMRHAADALAALAGAPGAALPAPDLAALLGGVLGAEGAWERRQPDALLAVVRVLDAGLPRCAHTAAQC
jgi:ribosomal RNA-processing protein 12